MNWKLKAFIQNTVSSLPMAASYAAYYWIQRNFGSLKEINPSRKLTAGIRLWRKILTQNINPGNKTFFEVGTGRIPLMPLSYWLMGAQKVITVDVNPYLKEELIKESLQYILRNEKEVVGFFGPLLKTERFDALLRFAKKAEISQKSFLELCNIDYKVLLDVSNINFLSKSIDFHTSYNVLEHIHPNSLNTIFEQGNRIIKDKGLFVHRIDYSDHFSHTDSGISPINFLQYSDKKWGRYAGNRYMYMNRLRHDDFLKLYEQLNHLVLEASPEYCEECKKQVQNNEIRLDKRFHQKSEEVLSIISSWIVSQKKAESGYL